MKHKQRYIVRPEEVRITRIEDAAFIEYKEPDVPSTRLQIGPGLEAMTDGEIVELFNEALRSEARLAAEFKNIVVEVPLGSPQMEYHAQSNQWTPRGRVLRCLIHDDEEGRMVVEIDDRKLGIEEFARLLGTFAGWGMRIEFVPDDEVHRRPALQVREPDDL